MRNSLQEVFGYGGNEKETLLQLTLTLNQMIRGRSNATGVFTLTASASETIVRDNLFGPDMVPLLTPLTSSAASEQAQSAGTFYVSERGNGYFKVAHRSTSSTDRTFAYVRLG